MNSDKMIKKILTSLNRRRISSFTELRRDTQLYHNQVKMFVNYSIFKGWATQIKKGLKEKMHKRTEKFYSITESGKEKLSKLRGKRI